jgi:hypothetical protein
MGAHYLFADICAFELQAGLVCCTFRSYKPMHRTMWGKAESERIRESALAGAVPSPYGERRGTGRGGVVVCVEEHNGDLAH